MYHGPWQSAQKYRIWWRKLVSYGQLFFNCLSKTKTTKRQIAKHLSDGQWAEQQAERYLLSQGLILLARNFSCTGGEIDRIMRQQQTLVFVEVRYRQSGGALASINRAKQQKILKCSAHYLRCHKQAAINLACRFDIITIEGLKKQPTLHWIKDAFRA
ncbi:YraN family protein [Candidatus Venteria ishoeyi]|uniref:UPF0102 protein MBHS_01403 n=1 Tax=Candidatus Venteria ishoeyi TaxID=1899563 RepID=A0A1H6F7R8_9GAMM|nr:YraN family protein [Candidatus Venteria ishoeyi]MDM8545280.1 YraN family protein [Candidatus Venteria ishoeyi]SEH05548.1 Uncharacterised protein [Candidatus Venteria ishoeyi]SEH05603.1 Uncharacterised protein [Candidatus Venteria ishoeyi]